MTEIIGVRFQSGGKSYYFAPGELQVTPEQGVIVETGKGPEYGVCAQGNTMVEDDQVVQPLRSVIRLATDKDLAMMEGNREKEKKAMAICQKKVEEHGLDMKLVRVEYSFDSSRILFFFTSEGRVDFRALVKDLAGIFHARIELRQIGVRDEARMIGGLGICGRPFCCNGFLEEFQPVSIKMAKTQNLSLNPTKISGTCGRLMCCLKYEQDAYEDAVSRCPKQESFVECPDGVGNISSVNLLRETVKVRLEDSTEAPKSYSVKEVRVVRSGKGKRPDDYVAPPRAELEKLRLRPVADGENAEPVEHTPFDSESGHGLGTAIGSVLARDEAAAASASAEERKPARSRRPRPPRSAGKPEGKPENRDAGPRPEKTPDASRQSPRQEGNNRPPRPPTQDRPAPKPPRTAGESSAPAAPGSGPAPAAAEGGEKKPRHRNRRRPRRPKAPGEGQSPAPQSGE